MIIREMNVGEKIECEIFENRITLDDDLSINLAKREEDWPVHIDVCYDVNHALVVGTATGNAYVAQIDIPARQYDVQETVGEDGETVTTRIPLPLDMDNVILSLWAIN